MTDRPAAGAPEKPVVLVTGAAGNLGRSIAAGLGERYSVAGLDRDAGNAGFPVAEADLTDAASIDAGLAAVKSRFGGRLASVIHLAAYFDFSGEDNPLYDKLNVEGTRLLLRALNAGFEVGQFVYASTMLVHAPCAPGELIAEDSPIEPRWAYPRSKARAEAAVREEAGDIPWLILRLAGVYDEQDVVPTLAHQIARIADQDLESRLYPGDLEAGQSMLHREDMVDAFRRAVDRREELPRALALLIGEPEAIGYGELQDRIGCLVHGEERWTTLRIPKPVAAAGAWVQEQAAELVPDAVAELDEPFVKPFMVSMADDHYALDIGRARDRLGWSPRHRLLGTLPAIVRDYQQDPTAWKKRNLAA